ncbi:MAG: fumarate hydratase, partial [Myxococcota bacterium]
GVLLRENIEIAEREQRLLSSDEGVVCWRVCCSPQTNLERGLWRDAIETGMKKALLEYPYIQPQSCVFDERLEGQIQSRFCTQIEVEESSDASRIVLSCVRSSSTTQEHTYMRCFEAPLDKDLLVAWAQSVMGELGLGGVPPWFVGVGLGGSRNGVVSLAERALRRPVGKPHQSLALASLEQALLQALNATSSGVFGLGGDTVLAVHTASAPCHSRVIPASLVFQNYLFRMAEYRWREEGV